MLAVRFYKVIMVRDVPKHSLLETLPWSGLRQLGDAEAH